MIVPLLVLAVGSIAAGYIHVPDIVRPVFRLPPAHAEHEAWLPVVATVTAVLGIVAAAYLYLVYRDLPGRISAALRPLHRLLEAKYYFDDAYDWFVRRVVVEGSERLLWRRADVSMIDGAVNGAAAVTTTVAHRVRQVQTGFVRAYVLCILGGAVAVLGYLLYFR
jgi:NADH-quinone oxidoreductase subunit L